MVNFLHGMIFGTSQDPQQRSPYVHYFLRHLFSTADSCPSTAASCWPLLGFVTLKQAIFRMSGWFSLVVLFFWVSPYTWWNDGLNPPTSFIGFSQISHQSYPSKFDEPNMTSSDGHFVDVSLNKGGSLCSWFVANVHLALVVRNSSSCGMFFFNWAMLTNKRAVWNEHRVT